MDSTVSLYEKIMEECRLVFSKKMVDYGSSWRILRLSSLTDQIFIKAQRIRQLQENTVRKVAEGEQSDL